MIDELAWVDELHVTRAALKATPRWRWRKRRALERHIKAVKFLGFSHLYGRKS